MKKPSPVCPGSAFDPFISLISFSASAPLRYGFDGALSFFVCVLFSSDIKLLVAFHVENIELEILFADGLVEFRTHFDLFYGGSHIKVHMIEMDRLANVLCSQLQTGGVVLIFAQGEVDRFNLLPVRFQTDKFFRMLFFLLFLFLEKHNITRGYYTVCVGKCQYEATDGTYFLRAAFCRAYFSLVA